MRIKVTDKIERDVEIELPYFSIDNCHAYKVISEQYAIQVCYLLANSEGIKVVHSGMAFHADNKKCSELEFVNAYGKTLSTLNKHLEA